jgi:hypothetical protein
MLHAVPSCSDVRLPNRHVLIFSFWYIYSSKMSSRMYLRACRLKETTMLELKLHKLRLNLGYRAPKRGVAGLGLGGKQLYYKTKSTSVQSEFGRHVVSSNDCELR